MGARSFVVVGALGVGLGLAGPARADETRRFAVTMHSPASCPGEAELVRQIRDRAPHAEISRAGERGFVFDVAVSEEPGSSVGRMVVVDPSGASSTREIIGRDCREVTSALALVAALLVEPRAGEPAPTAATVTAPSRTAPGVAATVPWGLRGWLAGGAEHAAGPRVALRLAAGFGVERRADDWIAPLLILEASRVWDSRADVEGGDATFSTIGARLGGCPIASPGWLRLRPCAAFDAGIVPGQGHGVARPLSATAPWLAALLGMRAEVEIGSIFWLGAGLDLVFPVTRHRFYFDPGAVEAHHVRAVGYSSSLDLGVRFP